MVEFEKAKICGAVRTDFVLSAEIITITLGTVAGAPFVRQLAVLSTMSLLMTVGVYGFVAAIVKLDDAGLYLSRTTDAGGLGRARRALGAGLLAAAPLLMKSLSVVGTVAMFLVGGGILVHGAPGAHGVIRHLLAPLDGLPVLPGLASAAVDGLAGVLAGAVVLAGVMLATRLKQRLRPQPR